MTKPIEPRELSYSDAIKLLATYADSGRPEIPVREVYTHRHQTESQNVEKLLTILKKQLITSGKEINPLGALAKCIDTIQARENLDIVDVYLLNKNIKTRSICESKSDKNGGLHKTKHTKTDSVLSYFNGSWASNNPDAIKVVLNTEIPSDIADKMYLKQDKDTELEKIKKTLYSLREELIASGNEINPYGALARYIKNLQNTINWQVIDIDELNNEIKIQSTKVKYS